MKRVVVIFLILFLIPVTVSAKEVEVTLKKCVDGDTARVIINKKEKSVRFLAINTPEIQHGKKKAEPYGVAASKYTCEKLKSAKKIVIEYDDNSDKTDKYGRVLGWIFVDGKLLQQDLVKNGYAEVKYLYGDYKYTSILQKEEKKAKSKKLNMWSGNNKVDDDDKDFIDIILDKIFKYIRKQIKSML